MYPVIGLTIMLKIGINVKIIPIIIIGIPRCLAIVGKNGFIGPIPETMNIIRQNQFKLKTFTSGAYSSLLSL